MLYFKSVILYCHTARPSQNFYHFANLALIMFPVYVLLSQTIFVWKIFIFPVLIIKNLMGKFYNVRLIILCYVRIEENLCRYFIGEEVCLSGGYHAHYVEDLQYNPQKTYLNTV